MRTKGDRNGLVQVLMNSDATTGERGAQLTAFELPGLIGETYRVVAGHDPLVLQRKDQIEILAPQRHESSASLSSRLTETLIELQHILFTEKPVGLLQSFDLPGSQFGRQPSLLGAEAAFTATTGLR